MLEHQFCHFVLSYRLEYSEGHCQYEMSQTYQQCHDQQSVDRGDIQGRLRASPVDNLDYLRQGNELPDVKTKDLSEQQSKDRGGNARCEEDPPPRPQGRVLPCRKQYGKSADNETVTKISEHHAEEDGKHQSDQRSWINLSPSGETLVFGNLLK